MLLYSDRESGLARAFSFVGTHNAPISKSYSIVSNNHLRKTCMEAPRMVRLAIPWAPAWLSTCITSAFHFHLEAQCSRTYSTTPISAALMQSLPLAIGKGIGIENAESGSRCTGL